MPECGEAASVRTFACRSDALVLWCTGRRGRRQQVPTLPFPVARGGQRLASLQAPSGLSWVFCVSFLVV